MFTRPQSQVLCARCFARRYLSTPSSSSSSSSSHTPLPAPPPRSGVAKLTNRRLLSLHGHDAAHFLQGIATQNIRAGQSTGFYSAFLNAQGRVLHDVFIYPTTHAKAITSSLSEDATDNPSYLIEVDAAEAPRLLSHIKKYKLRAKLSARLVEPGEYDVWSVWRAEEKWTAHPSPGANFTSKDDIPTIGCPDTRAPGLGHRLILPSSQTPSSQTPNAPPETPLTSYTLRRILAGVPEGQSEILRETALPQESNIDYMGGIDFRKGCYVGQELTIRTHHTGVVRKRILPVRVYGDGEGVPEKLEYDASWTGVVPPAGANIARVGAKGRSAGKWVMGVGNVGLALCRLEIMTDVVLTEGGGGWSPDQEFRVVWSEGEGEGGEVKVEAFVPNWHRNRPGVRDAQRERNA